MLKLFGFTHCAESWEDLVKDGEKSPCPVCGKKVTRDRVHKVNFGAFSILSPEAKKAALAKRSREHTYKEGRKEPERWGRDGIKRFGR